VSVNDHGFLYADGVYETMRTFNGRVWLMNEHLKRLRKSAERIGIYVKWTNAQLSSWIKSVVKKNNFTESRIRLTVTRGENGYDFLTCKNPTIVIQVKKLDEVPDLLIKKGVKVVTQKIDRLLPEVKSISLLAMVLANRFAAEKKAYECIFIDDDDFVKEGSISNIFIVKDEVLFTPKKGILPGTTRNFILKLAKKRSITALEKNFRVNDLYCADEIFISNAPRGIVPVSEVDDYKIGRTGTVTKALMEHYKNDVERYK
jgi:branched-chain amino acid aminotransferase